MTGAGEGGAGVAEDDGTVEEAGAGGRSDTLAGLPGKTPRRRSGAVRVHTAARAAVSVGAVSRLLRVGGGSVAGGRIGLALAPDLVRRLAEDRPVALVSGTNGKTTTTRLLATALGGAKQVATSSAGANLPAGIVVALASARPRVPAILEVDEAYLAAVADAVRPVVVVLLNLSRDQLDRVSEVRAVATRWRAAMARQERATVVANADDPLVAWAASASPRVIWVAAGVLWRGDAVGCPACDGQIVYDDVGDRSWYCPTCGLAAPVPAARLDGSEVVLADGRRWAITTGLPGRCNRANAAMAAVAAEVLGVAGDQALAAMEQVDAVEGRFARIEHGGYQVRLLLAKNPAGWAEVLDLLEEGTEPVVVAINAQVADGRDPSWLWDVPFERLRGRLVIASGERAHDLAVRLRHAGVAHRSEVDQMLALAGAGARSLDYVGNYTAFQALRHLLTRPAKSQREPKAVSDPARTARPLPVPVSSPGAPAAARRGVQPASPSSPGAPAVPARGDRPDRASEPVAPLPQGRGAASSAGRGEKVDGTSGARRAGGASALRVVVVHPDLLGTYGDGGNALVLANRARWRGLEVELLAVHAEDALPDGGDIYLLGGGEDGPQVHSAHLLGDGRLARAVDHGATVLAVCAGFQMLGASFPGPDAQLRPGLGLLDALTTKRSAPRAVGEVLAQPTAVPLAPEAVGDSEALAATAAAMVASGGLLSGFENHSGATVLGPGVRPLATVVRGAGNDGQGAEGAWQAKVIGTYLHGPVLARNPALADAVLTLATGKTLEALDDAEEQTLRAERLGAIEGRRHGHRIRRLRRRQAV